MITKELVEQIKYLLNINFIELKNFYFNIKINFINNAVTIIKKECGVAIIINSFISYNKDDI